MACLCLRLSPLSINRQFTTIELMIAFAGLLLWGAVIQVMHWPTQPEIAPLLEGDALAIALGFVAAALVAPITEEAFFRGFIIGGLRKRFGAIASLLISAVFFALVHPPLTIFPVIFMLGLMLGALLLQTGSLWPAIFLHMAFNTLGFVGQLALSGRN